VALSGKNVLIAGAGGGLGSAISRSLAGAGARLALLGRTLERLEATRQSLPAGDVDHVVMACDFTDRRQTDEAVGNVLAAVGGIDILVYAAGVNVSGRSMRSLSHADWDAVLAANLTGAFNLARAVLPSMRDRGSGLIIQMGSLAGKRANVVSGAAYSAAKFGQTALGTCISREERGRGIRCTMIHAGEVDTPFLDARASRPGGGENTRRQMILKPEDIAETVRFVAELPLRAHVVELIIKPAVDDFT